MQLSRSILFLTLLLFGAVRLSAHCALLSPEGGEIFTAGQIIQIEWVVIIEHETENWDLYLSADGGDTWDPIVLDLPVNQLSYQWSVPYTETMAGRVRVVQDNIGMDYIDASDDFTIVVLPFNGPEITTTAQDLTLQCGTDNPDTQIETWLGNNGGAMATGNCGEINWSHDYSGLSNGCGMTGMAVVTFSVSDDCGGTLTTATVSIQDSEGPIIEGPATDMAVECDGNGNLQELNNWLSSAAGASAFDACGSITWADDFSTLTPGCGSTGVATVTFMAYDDCGNMSTTSAQFVIVDSTPPVVMASAQDTILNCMGSDPAPMIQGWLNSHGNALAVDVCSGITWTNDLTDPPGECNNTFSRLVKFVVSDACGNISMTEATLMLEGAVGVDDPGIPGLRMFPNPAREEVEIVVPPGVETAYSIRIYHVVGELVLNQMIGSGHTIIHIEDFVPGLYAVRISGHEGIYTANLLVR